MIRNLALTLVACASLASTSAFAADQADNSKVNVRDRSAHEVTADQQSNAPADIEVTRAIRQALVKDSSFSTYAQNLKVITINGMVTLKGPVRSTAEKSKAEALAKSIAGVSKVDNQLSVKR